MPIDPAAFLKSVKDGLHEKLLKSTVPIVVDDRNAAGVEATGVLLRVADRHFILSVSHLLRHVAANADRLGIALADGRLLQLAVGRVSWAADDDRFDIGAVLLHEKATEALVSSGFCFLDIGDVDDIDPSSPPPGGYVIFGYPTAATVTGTDGSITPVPHYLGSVVHRGDTKGLSSFEFDPTIHVLLKFNRAQVRNTDTGEITTAPEPHGLSGSSVWWAYEPSDAEGDWRPGLARMVGIQSSYFRSSGLLKFTPWQFVQRLLAQEYPDIASVLALRGAGRTAILLPR